MKCTSADLEKAIYIAVNAHLGQRDKADEPYIFHPLRVMNSCSSLEAKIVAILHDVIEDTDVSIETIEQAFPPQIVDALRLLTHRADTPYMEYVEAIACNQLAREIKIADLRDNSNIARLDAIHDKDVERFRKYNEALKLLEGKE